MEWVGLAKAAQWLEEKGGETSGSHGKSTHP